MVHQSIKLNTPIEFINIVPFNPLISKCQIKVCYVSDEPNRNRSIITKEVAKKMANSLPGSPIVGYYNEDKQDFEEHERVLEISPKGELRLKDITKPYGFIDLNAKVWFQKFLDDDAQEREYLMTEGWLWTGQYPECSRVITQGNNQSMELDKKIIDAYWTKDENGKPQFFIINEAIFSKLCILGNEEEPCFEASRVTAPTIQFSLEDDFKVELLSMMNELKKLLSNEGGNQMFTKYSVTVGDALWTAIYDRVAEEYAIEAVCEDSEQNFAVLKKEDKYYRLNFSIQNEESIVEFAKQVEELENYVADEEPQFTPEDIANFVKSRETSEEESEEEEVGVEENSENSEENSDKNGQEENDESQNISEESLTYSLEEIPEYVELRTTYAELENKYNSLVEINKQLNESIEQLTKFKQAIEKQQKEAMIDNFYMLSDKDKADVVKNIDTYSLDEIESKLSVICVRNKVNFNPEEEKETADPVTYSLDSYLDEDDDGSAPAWVKAALKVAKEMN